MSQERERQFQQLVAEFPDSPMGHFSLGKLYLETARYAEAVKCLEDAVRLDPSYAAAMVSLGDAYAGAGKREQAREIWTRARNTALAQSHASLAEDIDVRLEDL
jgi:predicted Zn-dependent protease